MSVEWVWPIAIHKVGSLEDLPHDAVVLTVNGKPCIGRCIVCKKPLTTEDNYTFEHLDGIACISCLEALEGDDASN
jgi:hypothetical protein